MFACLVMLRVCSRLKLNDVVTKIGLHKQNVQPVHVVFTSRKCEDKPCSDVEIQVEANCAAAFSYLEPGIIEFVHVPAFVTRNNKYGLPQLESLFMYAYELYPRASTYTYVNSDLITDKSFYRTIKFVSEKLRGTDLVIVGTRADVVWNKNWSWTKDFDFTSKFKSGTMARQDAVDYFVTTRNAIRWHSVPPFVIGRPAFDNWLVNYAAQSPHVLLIDASKTIKMLHQSIQSGLDHWESMSVLDDRDFNRHIGHGGYHVGYTYIAKCYTKYLGSRIRLAGHCKTSAL